VCPASLKSLIVFDFRFCQLLLTYYRQPYARGCFS
jgi:hypothetical protein